MNELNRPRFSELLDWLEGRLPLQEARIVAERLQTADAATRADLDWLRLFLQARQSVQFASPPSGIREALRREFASYAEARQPPGLFQRFLASLTFDSRTQPAVAGLRSAAGEVGQRQLLYSTESAEIALTIDHSQTHKTFTISGQIFPGRDGPMHMFSVQLLRNDGEVALAAADELGEFSFAEIPAGEYGIVVSGGQFEVVIPSLFLQS